MAILKSEIVPKNSGAAFELKTGQRLWEQSQNGFEDDDLLLYCPARGLDCCLEVLRMTA